MSAISPVAFSTSLSLNNVLKGWEHFERSIEMIVARWDNPSTYEIEEFKVMFDYIGSLRPASVS